MEPITCIKLWNKLLLSPDKTSNWNYPKVPGNAGEYTPYMPKVCFAIQHDCILPHYGGGGRGSYWGVGKDKEIDSHSDIITICILLVSQCSVCNTVLLSCVILMVLQMDLCQSPFFCESSPCLLSPLNPCLSRDVPVRKGTKFASCYSPLACTGSML